MTMNILISGSSGLVGSALVPSLVAHGHKIMRLVRRQGATGTPEIHWDPAGTLDPAALDGFDAVVHLAGESIAGRWTPAKKARIRHSRVQGTRTVATAMAKCARPPGILICASAVGYYGDRGQEVLTEASPPGTGFLAETCQEWEAASAAALAVGVRVVQLRFGMILSRNGGALKLMLPPFRLGLGGRLGSGRQYMSWISIEDVVGVIQHALTTDSVKGPANAVSPVAVTNAEFTKTLGGVLRRPTIFPMPAFAVRTLFGEMGQELLLASQRVLPERLRQSGYSFRHPELEQALRALL